MGISLPGHLGFMRALTFSLQGINASIGADPVIQPCHGHTFLGNWKGLICLTQPTLANGFSESPLLL